MRKKSKKIMELAKWVWSFYIKSTLLPMIVICCIFIAVSILIQNTTVNTTTNSLREQLQEELQKTTVQDTQNIDEQLINVNYLTDMYANQTKQALNTESTISPEDSQRLAYSADGIYYTTKDTNQGGAAVFYSGYYPINEKERDKVARVLETQYMMKDMQMGHPLVASIYLNTFDSLNLIYPYFDVISQYPGGMDIPAYNFYYEADAEHNPDRGVEWTDVYLDPAGHGWMASCIAPVYNGDFLEGVVGLDVTVSLIIEQVLNLDIGWDGYAMLIGSDGMILALPESGEKDWGLSELTEHHYAQAIYQDTYKPDEFNVNNWEELSGFIGAMNKNDSGLSNITLNGDDKLVSWATVDTTDWKLMYIVSESSIYADVDRLEKAEGNKNLMILLGLTVFFVLFVLLLFQRSRALSGKILSPLLKINDMTKRIGQGEYNQETSDFGVVEFNETSDCIVDMGNQLGTKNKDLIEARNEAEKASQAKSQFLSNMSHELRTPLNAVIGFAQVLDIDPENPLNQPQQECVTEINKAGNHLLELINEVLDLAKIESGRVTMIVEPVSVRKIVEDTMALVKPIADRYRIQLTGDFSQCDCYIKADTIRMKQILINIINNAIKYNREKGSVNFYCDKHEGFVRFHIVDTGMGIPESELEEIFKPFSRLSATKNLVEGTGIGLAMVKEYVRLMDGDVEVDSEIGKGSHFYISIPEVPKDEVDEKVVEEKIVGPLYAGESKDKHKVLYVEDNPANLNLIQRVMTYIPNIELLSTTQSQAGIDIALSHKPDLILLDINLPDMDGHEVFRRLQTYDETKDIPVIAVSANAMEKDIQATLNMGFSDYFVKPINVPIFVDNLKRFFSIE